jgi:hypothetical protein
MSSVGNWTKKAEKQPYCAGKRLQHTCDRASGERAPTPVNVRWANDCPYLRTCTLGLLLLTRQARWTT